MCFILILSINQSVFAKENENGEVRLGSFVLVGIETNIEDSNKPEWFKEYYKKYLAWKALAENKDKKLADYVKNYSLFVTKEQAKEVTLLFGDDMFPLMYTPEEMGFIFNDFDGIEYLSNLERVGVSDSLFGGNYENGINSYPFSKEQIANYYERLVEGFRRENADALWPHLNKKTLKSDQNFPYDKELRKITKNKIRDKAEELLKRIDSFDLDQAKKDELKADIRSKLDKKMEDINKLNAYDLSTTDFDSKIEKETTKEVEKEVNKAETIDISVSKKWSDNSTDKTVVVKLLKKKANIVISPSVDGWDEEEIDLDMRSMPDTATTLSAPGNNNENATSSEANIPDGYEFVKGDADQVLTLTLNNTNSYKGIFNNLLKYEKDGETLIEYKVYEVKVDGYITSVSGNVEEGFVILNTKEKFKVTFMDNDSLYKEVTVEKGLSINSDSLSDQVMPENPHKDGYKFKEWNTNSDGNGEVFTGGTLVNENKTVYAVYEKVKEPNPVPIPDLTPVITNPDNGFNSSPSKELPKTGDSTNTFFEAILFVLLGSAIIGFSAKRKQKN